MFCDETYMTYMFVVFMWSCEILGLVALNLFGLHSFCWPQYFSCKPFFLLKVTKSEPIVSRR